MSFSVVRLSATAVAVCAAMAISACSTRQAEEPTTAPSTPVTSSSAQETTPTQASSSTSSTTTKQDEEEAAVAKVAEQFSTLAPPEFFDKLDTCVAVDVESSFDCSGANVGQFQFFDSDAKAASTTQLLTELRSSRIVEDTGERVVGWSTLGTSAIITVVDNSTGQVMQQLVSSDREDPRERIINLGLVDEDTATATGSETGTETEQSEPSPEAAS
ncbi:hypothetical protein [Corynebacterium lipophiloflavum]|uniref:Beta-N-acetylglucosaminidase n=1 Tax=Corynebacterium lipophiloflavum (strain ATCC 700352 / DSM 44291 / CCUG 37336 / JCM 10383 / DMMZ 1944) TaxID=525263 RepID=C0XV94_CORLD|nr:hypothetical protein [Corynebacterium lipophiloflavum]EEI15860.1 hypothetical protein HMPREF0298_2364 [Corynebacterium lipophiloflavum DSM 44291]